MVGKDGAGAANVGLFAGDVAIVPSLKAPGFCNAYVEINKVDMSAYDGTRNTMASTSNFPIFFGRQGVKNMAGYLFVLISDNGTPSHGLCAVSKT